MNGEENREMVQLPDPVCELRLVKLAVALAEVRQVKSSDLRNRALHDGILYPSGRTLLYGWRSVRLVQPIGDKLANAGQAFTTKTVSGPSFGSLRA